MGGSFGASTQTAAIRTVVQYSAIRAVDVVLAAYRGSKSREAKETVIDALAKWHDWSDLVASDLVALAKRERDPTLRRRMISSLEKTNDPIAWRRTTLILRVCAKGKVSE
jgi:hypothetical protein